MGSRGTIIKVGVLFVHIIVEVRLRDTDRGLKMFCVFWFHIIMIILVLCYFANLYVWPSGLSTKIISSREIITMQGLHDTYH